MSGAPELDLDRLKAIEPPVAADPAATLARWTADGHRPDVFVGDGAEKYRDLIGSPSVIGMPVLAGAIGRLAAARARRGEAIAPAALQPLYVRRPDAEIARDKK